MIAVVDTSAFLRLFIPDGEVPDGLEELFRGVERGMDAAIAPELMLAEAANALNKKRLQGSISLEECLELVELCRAMPVRYYPHADLLAPATRLAAEQSLTVYDALFLALALRTGARLLIADDRLAKAARSLHL